MEKNFFKKNGRWFVKTESDKFGHVALKLLKMLHWRRVLCFIIATSDIFIIILRENLEENLK